jgi:hypothetical protein
MAIATAKTAATQEIQSLPQGDLQQKIKAMLDPVSYLGQLARLNPDLATMPAAGYPKPLIVTYHPEAV